MKGLAFRRRLGFALQGISIALHRERSFRTQCLAGAAVLVVLLLLLRRKKGKKPRPDAN